MNPLEDPLDQEDFDSVQYINQMFPTESSLDELDTFVNKIGSQISALDEEISKAVQSQSVLGQQVTKDVLEAQDHIEELFNKIQDIKLKATQSENMVQDLCVDIKKLDCAKNHLQTSITSLNRLQMLINAVNQLEILAQDFHYKEVANLLDAVKQFMSHFEKYREIAIISDLHKRIESIRQHLTKHIKAIFHEIAEKMDSVADIEIILVDLIPGGSKGLGDACHVIDALGNNVRRDFFSDFVKSQLVGYDQLFGPDKDFFALEFMERRFSWFKRLVKYIEQKFASIFPAHWRIPLRLCLEFIERTKMHLILCLSQMETREEEEGTDVQLLLKALQGSIKFEQEMAEKFQLLSELKKYQQTEEKGSMPSLKELEMQKKLQQEDKLMYIRIDYDLINAEEESESGFLSLAHNVLSNGISSIFDKFLGAYVALVKTNLEEMLKRVVSEEEVTHTGAQAGGEGEQQPSSNKNSIYNSSTNMFIFIKNAIKQCISLSNGMTLLSLSEEFQEVILEYASILSNRTSNDTMVCYVINTAEYCTEVIPQLEQMIQQKIVPSLSAKVNYQDLVDSYLDVIARHMKQLVGITLDKMEPGYRTMLNTNWGAFEQVSEESKYLLMFNNVLLDTIPRIRQVLSASFFQNFCTKLATEILTKYQESLLRARRISDLATQQLLLDTYALKTLLLALPNLQPVDSNTGSTAKPSPSTNSIYIKLINGKATHIEVLLKLIGTPEEMLVERFRMLWPDGTPSDLQMLMTLKGTKRNDQQVILEMLGLSAASKILNKTANMFQNNPHSPGQNNAGMGSSASNAAASFAATTASYTAATSAASAAAFSSMKSLTQDLSSTARNAVGNLKWSSNK